MKKNTSDIEKQLTTAPDPDGQAWAKHPQAMLDKAAHVAAVEKAVDEPAKPPPTTDLYPKLEAMYRSLSQTQLEPIRAAKGFDMIAEYKERSPEDQNDLLLAMQDAEKSDGPV